MHSAVGGSGWELQYMVFWLAGRLYKSMQKRVVNLERDKINNNLASNCVRFLRSKTPSKTSDHNPSFLHVYHSPTEKKLRQRFTRELILLYGFFCTLANLCSHRKPSVCCMNRHTFERWWKLRTARLLITLTWAASVINRSRKYQFTLAGR